MTDRAIIFDKRPDARASQDGKLVQVIEIHGLTEDECAAFEAFMVGIVHIDEYFADVVAAYHKFKDKA